MKTLRDTLKNVPIGTKIWCDVFGEMTLANVRKDCYEYPITLYDKNNGIHAFTETGAYTTINGSKCPCVLWPNKDTRTWDNYKLPIKKELSKPAVISPNLKYFLEKYTDYYDYTNSNHVNTVIKWLREIHGLYIGMEGIKETEPSYEGITNVRIMYKPTVFSDVNEERKVFNFSSNKWNSAVEHGIIETIKYFFINK